MRKRRSHRKTFVSRAALWGGVCFVSLLFVLTASCEQAPKLGAAGELRIKSTLSVESGGGQVSFPRRYLDSPIVFKVVDDQGRPFANAKVSFCLADVTNLPSLELPITDLVAKCQVDQIANEKAVENSNVTTLPTRKTPEDNVGAILSGPQATDSQGLAVVSLKAPTAFGKRIGVVMYLTEFLKDNLGIVATFSTPPLGSEQTMSLVSTGGGREVAAVPFELVIQATDKDGFIVGDFAGSREFTLTAALNPSWTGRQSRLPTEPFVCTFVGGRCSIP